MRTITLNTSVKYEENCTGKYWREIECHPQTVELNTWSTNHPLFILKGTVTRSHDPKEIGTVRDNYVQTYSFWLNPEIEKGTYTVEP